MAMRRVLLLVMVFVAVSGCTVESPDPPTTPTSTSTPTSPAPVPDDPTKERWRWDDEPIDDAVPGGMGVVAVTDDGDVLGIDGRTGRRLWRRAGLSIDTLLAVPGGRAVILGSDSNVTVVDAFTGKTGWHKDSMTAVPLMAASKSTVVVPLDTGLSGFDLRSGALRWRWRVPAGCALDSQALQNAPLGWVGRDVVYAPFECSRRSSMVALDAASGHALWRYPNRLWPSKPPVPIGAGAVALRISPHFGGDTVALDEQSGRRVARTTDLLTISAAAADTLDVLTDDGIWRIGQPKPRWKPPEPPVQGSDPTIIGDRLLAFTAGCAKGTRLSLFDIESGTKLRTFGCIESTAVENHAWMVAAPGALVVWSEGALIGFA